MSFNNNRLARYGRPIASVINTDPLSRSCFNLVLPLAKGDLELASDATSPLTYSSQHEPVLDVDPTQYPTDYSLYFYDKWFLGAYYSTTSADNCPFTAIARAHYGKTTFDRSEPECPASVYERGSIICKAHVAMTLRAFGEDCETPDIPTSAETRLDFSNNFFPMCAYIAALGMRARKRFLEFVVFCMGDNYFEEYEPSSLTYEYLFFFDEDGKMPYFDKRVDIGPFLEYTSGRDLQADTDSAHYTFLLELYVLLAFTAAEPLHPLFACLRFALDGHTHVLPALAGQAPLAQRLLSATSSKRCDGKPVIEHGIIVSLMREVARTKHLQEENERLQALVSSYQQTLDEHARIAEWYADSLRERPPAPPKHYEHVARITSAVRKKYAHTHHIPKPAPRAALPPRGKVTGIRLTPAQLLVRHAFKHSQLQRRRTTIQSLYVRALTRRIFSRVGALHVTLQSGDVPHKQQRALREQRQKRLAASLDADYPRQASKRARQAYIAHKRRLKSELHLSPLIKRSRLDPQVELQSGVSTAAIVAGVAMVAHSLRKITKSVTTRVDSLSKGILSTFESIVQKIKDVPRVLCILLVAVAALYVLHTQNMCSFFATGIAVAVGLLLSKFHKPLWTAVSSFFRTWTGGNAEPVAVEVQSGGINLNYRTFGKLLAVGFVASATGIKNKVSMTGELMKRFSLLDRASTGLESFGSWLASALESLVNFARGLFGKKPVTLFKKVDTALEAWCKKVDEVDLRSTLVKDVPSADYLTSLSNLMIEGHGLRELYRRDTQGVIVDRYLRKLNDIIQPFQGAMNARNNFRVEPVAVMLRGAPGIGKSRSVTFFCGTLLKLAGLVAADSGDKVLEELWQKGTSQYWNSYAGQQCVVMDDVFQQTVVPGQEGTDYMELIRMIGSWAMPLNFADLPSKGKIFFTSKLVVGTTNASNFVHEAEKILIKPEALNRRLRFSYTMALDPQYAVGEDGTLPFHIWDAEKTRAEANEDPLLRYPWHMWKLYKHDFLTGKTDTTPLDFVHVIREIATELRNRQASFRDDVTSLTRYLSGITMQSGDDDSVAGDAGDEPLPFAEHYTMDDGYKVAIDEDLARVLEQPRPRGLWQLLEKRAADTRHALEKILGKRILFAVMAAMVLGLLKVAVDIAFAFFKKLFAPTKSSTDESGVKEKQKHVEVPPTIASNLELLTGTKTKNKSTVVDVQSNVRMAREKSYAVPQLQSGDDLLDRSIDCLYNLVVSPKSTTLNKTDTFNNIGSMVFVNTHEAIMPAHFYAHMVHLWKDNEAKGAGELWVHVLNAKQEKFSFQIPLSTFLTSRWHVYKGHELAMVYLPDTRHHKNLEARFLKEADLKTVGGRDGRIDIADHTYGRSRVTMYIPSIKMEAAGFVQDVTFGDIPYVAKTTRIVSYGVHTIKGDCGGIISLADSASYGGRLILGIHVGAKGGRGLATIITEEMVKEGLAALNSVRDCFDEDIRTRGVDIQSSSDLPFDICVDEARRECSFMPLYKVKWEHAAPRVPDSSYFKTDMYDRAPFGPYSYAPAALKPVRRNGVEINPMEKALEPYSTLPFVPLMPNIDIVADVAFSKLTAHTCDVTRRLYSFDEAVLGVPADKFRPVPRNTGPGWPYVLHHKGKTDFFGDKELYDLTSPHCVELRSRVDYIIDQAKKGNRLSHVFMDFLKDELRSPAKNEAVATRLISSAPVDYTVAWRMYFGCFSAAVMRNHTKVGMAPGISCYQDWGKLSSFLQQKGNKVFDGDFKGLDASEQPAVHRVILEYINRWYDDGAENARVREVLWEELVHSRHIGGLGAKGDFIYQWTKSLPSGHPFTTIINSMYTLLALAYAYYEITGSMTSFWEFVHAVTYGDDNVVNPSDEIAEVYNQVTIAPVLKRTFRMTYTPATKDGNWTPYTTIDKVSFLKRSFRREENGFMACPLELDSFLFTPYYCKNKKLLKEIRRDVLRNSLEELSMHSREVWDEYANALYTEALDALPHGEVPIVANDRDKWQRIVRQRTDWF